MDMPKAARRARAVDGPSQPEQVGRLSFGPRGAKFTIGPRGKRVTVGLPGTGLFYTTTLSSGRSGARGRASAPAPTAPVVRPEDRLTLGFFKRLVTPDGEEARVYEALGQHRRARSEFEKLYAEAPDYEDVAARLGIAAVTPQGGDRT